MKNQSVSDFVAATMDAVLNSKEHKSLFDVQYKYAQDMNAAKDSCSDCGSKHDGDSCMADDDNNDARKSKKDDDESSAWDDNDARKAKKDDEDDASFAWDDNDARKKKKDDEDEDKEDDSDASDGLEPSAAFDVAIDSLLTASAALDSVGLGRGSALVLKLASLTVEAKKKDKKDKDSKKKDSQSAKDKKSDKKSDSKKSDKKDSQSAKDKKSDSKKSDSKKSDSKKPFPFAKKK